ncbi:accessory gene regulator B family protein [Paraclostridium bifermentans]|uniref:accessory gene regulator B family protein n=1 Tax=Paraclostridium bifermentans TaxID=1490 RepID=UPI00359C8980
MVEALTDKVASFFISKNFINEDKHKNLKVRISSFIYLVISVISVYIVGEIFNRVIQGMILLVCYVSIRKFARGYKPQKYIIRLTMFISMFLLTIYLSNYDDLITYKALVTIFSMLSFGGIYMLAPVEDRKKILSYRTIKKQKIISRIISITILIVTIASLSNQQLHEYAAYTSSALFWSAILLVIGTIKNCII